MSISEVMTIKKKIQETEKEIESLSLFKENPFIGIQLEELQRRKSDLLLEKKRIEDACSKESLSLRVYGENIEEGRISNRILINVLSGFQEMLDDIANVDIGEKTERGKVQKKIRDICDLEICGMFAGSFGIKLEKKYEQVELTTDNLITNNILSDFFDIVENSSNEEKLIEIISPFGARTVRKYEKWLKEMQNESVNLELRWLDETSSYRKFDIESANIQGIVSALKSIRDVKTEKVVTIGKITGINVRKNSFEMQLNNKELIKGKGVYEVLIKARESLGEEVEVELTKNMTFSSACGEKVTWMLNNIH